MGNWLFDFDATGFNGPFWPRGIAADPNEPDYIYVTARSLLDPLAGWVLKFNVVTKALDKVFITASRDAPMFRPDGIVRGPGERHHCTTCI